jgi:hypothetical protein
MTAKKKAEQPETHADAPEQALTAEQSQELAGAGLDLAKLLEALRKSPILRAVIQQLIDTFFNPQPVFQAVAAPTGHDHTPDLDAALRSAICTVHCIACCCDHDHE